MSHTPDNEPSVGGAAGRSVPPLPTEEQPGEQSEEGHEGSVEIGIGIPVSAEEYRWLKREARSLDDDSDAVEHNPDSTQTDEE